MKSFPYVNKNGPLFSFALSKDRTSFGIDEYLWKIEGIEGFDLESIQQLSCIDGDSIYFISYDCMGEFPHRYRVPSLYKNNEKIAERVRSGFVFDGKTFLVRNERIYTSENETFDFGFKFPILRIVPIADIKNSIIITTTVDSYIYYIDQDLLKRINCENKSVGICSIFDNKIYTDSEYGKPFNLHLVKRTKPTYLTKIKNFAQAITEHTLNNFDLVSEEEKEKRFNICKNCDALEKDNKTCGQCGCNMEIKTGWASAECPLKKWLSFKIDQSCGCIK